MGGRKDGIEKNYLSRHHYGQRLCMVASLSLLEQLFIIGLEIRECKWETGDEINWGMACVAEIQARPRL